MLVLLVNTNCPPIIYREGNEESVLTPLVNPQVLATCGLILVYKIFLSSASTSASSLRAFTRSKSLRFPPCLGARQAMAAWAHVRPWLPGRTSGHGCLVARQAMAAWAHVRPWPPLACPSAPGRCRQAGEDLRELECSQAAKPPVSTPNLLLVKALPVMRS